MDAKEPIIRLQNIWKSFNRHAVLKGINLDIVEGRTTVIIGPSGCGKSVLLKHIVGLVRPDVGKVFFRDTEISRLGERRLSDVRKRIGFLFQGSALFDSMSVGQNVRFPMEEHEIGTPQQRERRMREALALVGLEDTADKFPEELSGGQKRRIALARAIVLDPEVILYDEPTTGLDPIRADLINELILRLQKAMKATAVVVTHDMESARKLGDRIVMLHDGHFIADAAPQDLDKIQNDMVARFIEGRVSQEELGELERISAAIARQQPDGGRQRMENGS
jgi:phospholipid/cholesterol/gamma-HCH transport system ATP-binding protein